MYIVIYAGGCYGQFVTFTLDWLQGNYSEDFRPFTPQGNAHDNNSLTDMTPTRIRRS